MLKKIFSLIVPITTMGLVIGTIFFLKGAIQSNSSDTTFKIVTEIIAAFALIGICLFIIKYYCGKNQLELFRVPKSKVSLASFSIFLIYLLLDYTINLYSFQEINFKKILHQVPSVLLSSIIEEIIFRGFLLLLLIKSNIKTWQAVIFSSIIFALAHFNYNFNEQWQMFISICFIGIALSYLFLISGSLYLPILYHFINNIFANLIATEDFSNNKSEVIYQQLIEMVPASILIVFTILVVKKCNISITNT